MRLSGCWKIIMGKVQKIIPDRARMEYLLAELYLGKQDTLQARHYLILASLTDIANAKKVYMSLQHLAILSRRRHCKGL